MIFGVLKDIKEGENRVICTPVEVASIKAAGHTVLVQSGAGVGSGFSDEKYAAAGGEIVSAAEEMWKRCDFLAKVKEIQPDEFGLPREGQMIYCCIHPAGHPEEVDALALFHQMKESIRVIFVPGDTFYPYGGHPNTARLSFATVSEEQIGEGMERMGGMLTQLLHQ